MKCSDLVAAVVAAVVALHPKLALAGEPSAADKETSRDLYAQGVKALDAHDYEAAERACAGAFKLVTAPTGALCWGQALEGLGKLVEARDAYLAAVHYPAKPDEPALFTSARETGRASADRLAKRIATVVLDVSGTPESTALEVTIDGAEIAPDTARLPRKLNPGHHVVVVAARGYQSARVEVSAADGQEQRVAVALRPETVVAGAPATVAPESAASPAPSRVPAWVAFGVGGAGLVVGTVFGVIALNDASDLKGQAGCPSSCPRSAQPQIDALHGHQWASDIGLGVGVVGAAVGAVFLLSSRAPEKPTSSVGLDLGPAFMRLRGRF
jgi:hypothetical protein